MFLLVNHHDSTMMYEVHIKISQFGEGYVLMDPYKDLSFLIIILMKWHI